MAEDTKKTDDVVEETPATEEAAAEAPAKEAAPAKEEKKEEAAPAVEEAEAEGADVEIPAEFKALVEQVENMSVIELNTLVKLLEKKFGVSAAATAVAGPAAGGAEEKSEFDVILTSDGGAKIPVMKVVKEILGLGLKEAKEFVEGAPNPIKTGVKPEEAEEIKAKIEAAGGTVELK